MIDMATEIGPKIIRIAQMAEYGTKSIVKDLDIEDKSIFDKFLFKGSHTDFKVQFQSNLPNV